MYKIARTIVNTWKDAKRYLFYSGRPIGSTETETSEGSASPTIRISTVNQLYLAAIKFGIWAKLDLFSAL